MASWTYAFFKDYARILTLPSLVRFWFFAVRSKGVKGKYRRELKLRLLSPLAWPCIIRPISNDLYTFREIFVDQVYVSLKSYVKAPKYIIDAGANIGLSALYFHSLWPLARLQCVEPDQDNIVLLKENLGRLLSSGTASIIQGGVWGESKDIMLLTDEPGHVNQRQCADYSGLCYQDAESVCAYTIQEVINQNGASIVDLLKMDIEGAEVSVFAGDLSWLRSVRFIAIEFHGNSRIESKFDGIIREHGFRVLHEDGHTVLVGKDALDFA